MTSGLQLPVKDGFKSDRALHVRNRRALEDWLRSRFVQSGHLQPGAVDAGALAPGAVSDVAVDSVSVSKLIDGVLSATAEVLGALFTGNLRWDSNGLSYLGSDGSVLFSVGVDGMAEPFIRGQGEFTGLMIENDLTIRGTGLMEAGATIRMGGAAAGETVGNPGAAPGLKVEWDRREYDELVGTETRGLAWDSTNTSWWTTQNPFSAFGREVSGTVFEFDNTTPLTSLRELAVPGLKKLYGVVRAGARVYVLGRTKADLIVVRTYTESTLAFIAEVNVGGPIPGQVHGTPGLGTDGSSLVIVDADTDGAGAKIRLHYFSLADVPIYSSTTTTSGAGNPTFNSDDVGVVGYARGEVLDWVALGGSRNRVYAFSGGVYQANNDFTNGESIRGLTHDGTRFHTSGGFAIVRHTNWKWTTESDRYHVAYTYVDDNSTVSVGARPLGAGDFETKKSPTASVTMLRRAKLRMSAAAVDTTLTGITHVGWYVNRGATEPTLDYQADTAVTNGTQTVRVIEDFTVDASPEAPPSANSFPAAASSSFATFESSDGSPILRANGYARCKLREDANQSIANATDTTVDFSGATIDSDTDGFVNVANDEIVAPFTGQYLVMASARFAANGTGYRTCFLEWWNGVGWDDTLIFQGARDNALPTNSLAGIAQFATIVNLTANDRMRFRVAQASTAALDLIDWNLQFIYLGPS